MAGVARPAWQLDLVRRLSNRGLDLSYPLRAGRYNASVPPAYHICAAGVGDGSLCLLVGNTRELWSPFLEWVRTRARDGTPPPGGWAAWDPIDEYCDSQVKEAATAAGSPPHEMYSVHEPAPGRRLAFQRLAAATGRFWFHSGSALCLHPEAGPWVAFRALLVFPGVDSAAGGAVESLLPCPAPAEELAQAEERVSAAVARAEAGCGDWRGWVRVRDAFTLGRAWRYGEDQLAYHYGQDRAALLRAAGCGP